MSGVRVLALATAGFALIGCGASPRVQPERGTAIAPPREETSSAADAPTSIEVVGESADAGVPVVEGAVAPAPDDAIGDEDAGAAAEAGPEPDIDASVGEDADVVATEADAARARRAARGSRVFDRYCSTCHEGGRRLRPRLSASRIRAQVRQGGRRMRAIPPSRVSEGDLRAVISFLQARLR